MTGALDLQTWVFPFLSVAPKIGLAFWGKYLSNETKAYFGKKVEEFKFLRICKFNALFAV